MGDKKNLQAITYVLVTQSYDFLISSLNTLFPQSPGLFQHADQNMKALLDGILS